ncbi:hypothetical protein ES703_84636 [subsurface metagenome]
MSAGYADQIIEDQVEPFTPDLAVFVKRQTTYGGVHGSFVTMTTKHPGHPTGPYHWLARLFVSAVFVLPGKVIHNVIDAPFERADHDLSFC